MAARFVLRYLWWVESGCPWNEHTEASYGAGEPAFDPALLLKLFLYRYQHLVRSSRRLEVELGRNQEVMCRGALPSYKTIVDFRKNNAIACRRSPGVCASVP